MSSTNPFDDESSNVVTVIDNSSGEILEGFLCPICREDLKSIEFLTDHFERSHAEEEDALKSIFKDIFSKAKKKILLNFDESQFDLSARNAAEKNVTGGVNGAAGGGGGGGAASGTAWNGIEISNASNATTRTNVYNFMERQTLGAERCHMQYFESIRNPRLERYASETNKLIIRLHKMLKDMPTDPLLRKQHEQKIVAWLDGSSVKLCPNCAKSFFIARRQHHCRLCGGIMCHDCSEFLPYENAMVLASLSNTRNTEQQHQQQQLNSHTNASSSSGANQRTIRLCQHCLWLLETRQDMHESRTCRPLMTQIYAEIKQLHKDITPELDMYLKIVNSLLDGESIFTLADASALRGKIGQVAEAMDYRSKRIFQLQCEPGSREESLKKAIRLSCIQTIKEKMLTLPPLPDEELIRQIQERKRMETKQRIETEQRMAMEAFARYGLAASASGNSSEQRQPQNATTAYRVDTGFVHGSDLHSINNWSAHQVSASAANAVTHDDPLVEQINIIKGYIKQARQELNFEVVETLEINLRELQREFYERQRIVAAMAAATTDDADDTKVRESRE